METSTATGRDEQASGASRAVTSLSKNVRSGRAKSQLQYVTDLERRPSGGGAYAVNFHAYEQLSRRFNVSYAGPIVPRVSVIEQSVSRINRMLLHRPGKFAYFSDRTLNRNAEAVSERLRGHHDGLIFRSATRWCRVRPTVPYFVYLDAVFHSFFKNTFRADDFERADLERIYEEEAEFLERASMVFFESNWGMQSARNAYSLRGSHYMIAGRGGAIAPPPDDTWDGASHRLITMAMDFHQKGGDLVFGAYQILKRRFPSLTWHIVGGSPDFAWERREGIVYEGYLRPDRPAELVRLQALLSSAFLLLHPTREDTSPLVITEAAYFGCPTISVNRFAIPELVLNGVTGLLLEHPTPGALANSVTELLENEQRYRDMRRNAREHALRNSDWDRVGRLISDRIADCLPT
jgi:glycosyltransferase involved in cell wall biosynthesis